MPAAPARAPRRRRQDLPVIKSTPGIGPIVILAGLLVLPIALAVTLDGTTYDTWGAYVWAPVLLALAFPLCRWVAKRTGEPEIAGFLFGAAVLKIVVGALARYYMVDAVYGAGDSQRYNAAGNELAEPFRRGIFDDLGQITGTRFMEIVTGGVQAVIGQTMLGSFLVFSAFGFVGLCFLYLAFCEALPTGNRRLYRWLLFLTPTMWFWPSSIGKEAFLTLGIGATAYGFSRMLNGRLSGTPLMLVGLWGVAVVRPHIALMLALGAVAAIPPERSSAPLASFDEPAPLRRPLLRLVLPVLVLAMLPFLLGSAERFFDIEGLNLETATDVRDEVARRTTQGGSEFSAPDTSNPVGLTQGLVTVLVRPFPWEASGAQLLSAVEGALIACLLIATALRARITGLVAMLRKRWVRFSTAFVLAYAWGFSAVGNFGILARQRSLLLPFLFVIVCWGWAPQTLRDEGADASGGAQSVPPSGRSRGASA